MYEIEIKARCRDIDRLKERLAAMGARHAHELEQSDVYFHHPQRNFIETDEAFRIRTVNGSSCVTYKGPKVSTESKTRKELETSVGDYDVIYAILTELGFTEGGRVEKVRTEYILDDVTICVDSVSGLGDFVELEKIGDDIEGTEKKLFALAADFGLDKFEKRSYLSLLSEKKEHP